MECLGECRKEREIQNHLFKRESDVTLLETKSK